MFSDPVVTWYRNNQLVKPSKYFKMDSSMDGVHTLTIMEAFPEDAGTYKCVARNKAGEVTVVTSLKVHGKYDELFDSFTLIGAFFKNFVKLKY